MEAYCPAVPFTSCPLSRCLKPAANPADRFNASSLDGCVKVCTNKNLDHRYAVYDPSAGSTESCTCITDCTAAYPTVASIQAAVQAAAIQYKYPNVSYGSSE